MTELESLEQRFWSKVWQCEHRHPCKRCCWPWKRIDLTTNWACIWQEHPSFAGRTAARFAYETRAGSLSFRGREFPICHQCHFGPCCNPWHVRPGSSSDNWNDRQLARHMRTITFPDGRTWTYIQAYAAEKAFWKARRGQHVWAGAVPQRYRHLEQDLHTPDKFFWPQLWPTKVS